MKSVKRTIVSVVTYNKRKRTATLRPKGTQSDYNGYSDVIVDGRTILSLQMASKVFIIICDVELGKPHKLPESPGIDPVRENDGLWGRGFGKKRMTSCNERYRGSILSLLKNPWKMLVPFWQIIICESPNGATQKSSGKHVQFRQHNA
jgi:hypothetical protein